MSQKPTSSENIVNQKYDRCLADLLVKTGVGFSIGVVASVIAFRRRAWPVAFTTGIGSGIAWADCDRLFNPTRGPGVRIVSQAQTPESK
ncbi:hypothetical protein JAAARDRAFT_36252 [Jaapia argillacea MUCL 33604]|uniref:MICOS complex subunit MIC10 n=1 Tax=Jaapia argillacea MUCL 33604 TaxID=933084 RepID=A0A067PZS2_9AGAM|nr:hypothetical protein JAAARDRAFT_36252 [Jaapia argillacea MUCL 33604]